MEEASGGNNKASKVGPVPFSLPFIYFLPVVANLRRKNLYPISPLPLLGFPFFFTAGQVFCSLLHALPEQENAWQVLKAQGRVGTSPSRLPSSAKLPCTRSLFLKRAGSSSGQKTERRGGGLIWFIV